MGCAYSPSGNAVACGGLDNKLTVFPLTLEEDSQVNRLQACWSSTYVYSFYSQSRKKTVGTHTSYTSCCLFPGSDNQVRAGL